MNWILRNKLSEILNNNAEIFIQENVSVNVFCKMSTIFSRLNVLTYHSTIFSRLNELTYHSQYKQSIVLQTNNFKDIFTNEEIRILTDLLLNIDL